MVLVIKIGDKVMGDALSEDALNDFETVTRQMQTILVHGGGNTVTGIAEKLGVKQKFVTSPEGFRSRYTDAETIQIYTMVMAGKINKEIVRHLESRKIHAIGLSGLDGGLIRAERKKKLIAKDESGRRRVIEGGYTGRVTSVDGSLLRMLLDGHYVPVIAPIALGSENEPLNLDGDRTAAHIASAIQADLLLLLTDVEGVSIGGTNIHRLNAAEAKQHLPSLGSGMSTKVHAALEALSNGVGKVVIASGRGKNPFTSAVREETGTLIAA